MMKTRMTQWVPCAISSANIRNIYKEEELEESITCAKFAHMGSEGDQTYEYTAYNLDGHNVLFH